MREQFFDDLAKGLDDGSISRGRTLKWIGAGAVAFAIGPLFPAQAEALTRRQRRRCRSGGGAPLGKGNCHCAYNCPVDDTPFTCKNNPTCKCYQTTEGRGFCAGSFGCPGQTCISSINCAPGWKCVVNTCCNPSTICVPPC
jgi:hypothetical protein